MSDPESFHWKKISIAIALLILVRGVFVLCVLPPFEGWDEYQHVAYIVYLREQHQVPIYGKAFVPESIRPTIKAYPHSANDAVQTADRGWGAKTYTDFWAQSESASNQTLDPKPVFLSQAQHPPLYYFLTLPFWIVFSKISALTAIYMLRLINVLFIAASVFIFLQILQQCAVRARHRLIIGLLIGLYPLFVINAARVANDALAILFGTLTLYFAINSLSRKTLKYIVLASCCLALGILTKATAVLMAPVVLAALVVGAYKQKTNLPNLLKRFGVVASVLFVFLAPLYFYHYMMTGQVYSMGRNVNFLLDDKSFWWVWSHAFKVGWNTQLIDWFFVRQFWVSGWSFVVEPGWLWFPYRVVMYGFWSLVIGVGLFRGFARRRSDTYPEYVFADNAHAVLIATVVITTIAGLAYYSVQCLANWGMIVVVPSYFMIALAAWVVLVYQAALFLGAKFAFWFSHIVLGFYLIAEIVGTLYLMPQVFTATTWSRESWRRIASMHPIFPSPWFMMPCLVIIFSLLIYLFRSTWRERPAH